MSIVDVALNIPVARAYSYRVPDALRQEPAPDRRPARGKVKSKGKVAESDETAPGGDPSAITDESVPSSGKDAAGLARAAITDESVPSSGRAAQGAAFSAGPAPESPVAEIPPLIGRRVEVLFAGRRLAGFIVALRDTPPEDMPADVELKPILRFIDKEPVCSEESLELARWLSSYYFCSLGQALATMIPAGRRGKAARKQLTPARDRGAGAALHTLNKGQADATAKITAALQAQSGQRFLLHGITGSGKTEVYRAIALEAVKLGQQVVLLVPEISLTPQMIGRFESLFPGQIAILHSSLTQAERISEWRRVAAGQARVVIGARSAVFAPVQNALFIIDEEHESSYKADDCPRYNARQVAFKRTAGQGTLVLGSATPSLETLWHARPVAGPAENAHKPENALMRLPLNERIAAHGEQEISIVDMREESPGTLISPKIINAIREARARGEQSLLFINRRGYATFVSCNDCAKAITCPQCSVSLTLHRSSHLTHSPPWPRDANASGSSHLTHSPPWPRDANVSGSSPAQGVLLCHYCGYTIPFTQSCPSCHGKNIRTGGAGTERILEFLLKRLPDIRAGRLDSDLVAASRGGAFKILEDFAEQRLDVIVGTQMIAKGHDFPNLTVVAILAADNELSLPDFRSYERVYHQILQVIGRAGRAQKKGYAFIQSALPFEDPIASIVKRDNDGFFQRELARRRECLWPPFSRLARIVMRSTDAEALHAAIHALSERLRAANEGSSVTILGPVACPMERRANYWRQHILLKSATLAPICALLRQEGLAEGSRGKVYIEIDVDPQSML
jgi:primosomal protein N' (replication factor Y)